MTTSAVTSTRGHGLPNSPVLADSMSTRTTCGVSRTTWSSPRASAAGSPVRRPSARSGDPPTRTPLGRVERFADVDGLAHDLAVPDLQDVDAVTRFAAVIADGHLS